MSYVEECSSWRPRPGCTCHVCRTGQTGIGADHRFWRERKQIRQQPQPPTNFQHDVRCACFCPTCRTTAQAEAEAEHLYWRERRRLQPTDREMLGEVLGEANTSSTASAVAYNRKSAARLGWAAYQYDIVEKVLRLNFSPTEVYFAELVAAWQRLNGLRPDGKIGPGTWAKMKQLLSVPKVSPQSGTKVYFPSGEYLVATTGDTGTGQEHWDILGSGNPLLDTSGTNKDKYLSRNFKAGEFSKSNDKARIDVKLVESLQRLRDSLGKSINITSGYRSYGYNKRLYESRGKTPTKSQHISGRAVDINVSGLNGLQLAKEALKACGCDIAIGLAGDYIHLDVRGKYTPGYQFTVWNYAADGGINSWITELKQFQKSLCP